MNRYFRLPCLMCALAVALPAMLPADKAQAVARLPGFDIQQLTRPLGQGSCTLAFYIPRPLRGPQA